jgi:hypothetical protein
MPEEQVPSPKKNDLQQTVDTLRGVTKTSPFKTLPKDTYIPNPELKSIRTFAGDMQQQIEKNKETVASIALAEQKKRIEKNEFTPTQIHSSKKLTGTFIGTAILFILLGGGVIGGLFVYYTKQPAEKNIVLENTPILYTTKKDIILGSPSLQSITEVLIAEKDIFKGPINTVLYTHFNQTENTLLSPELFMTALSPKASDTLHRNIKGYMAGVYSYDTNEVFFIVQPDDFGIVYSEMLKWETTLAENMKALFPKLSESMARTRPVFSDETLKSKDVRVIKDSEGNIVFIYGFIDHDTLVLTANEKVFDAIQVQYINKKLAR